MKYTLEERRQRALDLKKQGHNCCQSVAMAFGDDTARDQQLLSRLSVAVTSPKAWPLYTTDAAGE